MERKIRKINKTIGQHQDIFPQLQIFFRKIWKLKKPEICFECSFQWFSRHPLYNLIRQFMALSIYRGPKAKY